MLDQFLPTINEVHTNGAIVVLKWDGQRVENRYSVVITKPEVDYVWRQDSDDLAQMLQLALADYKRTQRL